jgi:ATP-dependent DNA helicase RecG
VKGRITNKEYQEIFGVARMTATRDLTVLVNKGILKSSETKGAGSYYEL